MKNETLLQYEVVFLMHLHCE